MNETDHSMSGTGDGLSVGPTSLIITGVGGQGNVVAARLVAAALLAEGYEVAVGDVFGLAQRGGSVASHVRFRRAGPLAPLVPAGELDLVVGFEPLEALRVLCSHGGPGTRVLTNDRAVPTTGTMMGRFEYPDDASLFGLFAELSGGLLSLDAVALAHQAGSSQALNVVMVGALVGSGFLPLSEAGVCARMEELLPARAAETNEKAFSLGLAAVRAPQGAAPSGGYE